MTIDFYWDVKQQTKPKKKNKHADISSRARGPNFCMSVFLYPNFVYASSECSGKSECLLLGNVLIRLSLTRYVWTGTNNEAEHFFF